MHRPPLLMGKFLAFGHHIGDMGKRSHPKMSQWVPVLNESLSRGTPVVKIVDWFGHTGNFVVDAESDDTLEIAVRLGEVSKTSFAVLTPADLRDLLCQLKTLETSPCNAGFRWTRGASFQIERYPAFVGAERWKTKIGDYVPLTMGMVAVWKRDRLEPEGSKLAAKGRIPWGGAGKDIQGKLGGLWTSRSEKTIEGLTRRVNA